MTWFLGLDDLPGSICTSLFDSTVRTSMDSSEKLVAMRVPSGDEGRPLARMSLRGDSTIFISHKRMAPP